MAMKKRFYLFTRASRGDRLYVLDTHTNKRESLDTTDRKEAARIVNAKNEALPSICKSHGHI